MDAQTDRCPGRCIEVQTDVQAEAQMDTQVDVQMDMQMDRQMDAQMGTQMDAWTDTQMDTETCIGRHTDVQADMQTNTQMIYRCLCVHRWTHRWMRRHTERCPDGHMGVQVDAQCDRWTYGWTPRCTEGHAGGCFIPFLSLDLEFLGGGVDESCDKYRSPCQEGTEMQAVCRWECTWFAEPFPSCEQICVGSRRQEASG